MNEIVAFNKTKADLARYRAAEGEKKFDLEDPQGIKDLRSHVYTLRKARSAFDKIRVSTKADALAACKNIDSQAKVILAGFTEMIDARTKPLKEIEEREEAEKQAALDKIREEREKEEAARLKDLEEREAEADRKEAEFKAKEDAIAAKEAAAKAEIDRIAREKKIAEDAKIEAEQEAGRKLRLAEEKRIADIAEAKRKIREETEAKEAAAQAEAERLAKIEADRVADEKLREKVEGDIHYQINLIVEDFDTTSRILTAIKDGAIPKITINY